MQTTKKSKKTWRGILVVLAVLALLSIIGIGMKKAGWFGSHTTPTQPTPAINYNPPTSEEKSAGDATKNSNTPSQSSTSTTPQTQPTPGSKTTVPVTITATNVSSSLFQIRALIESTTSTGTCTLSMQGPNGKTYSATAGIQVGPNSATCQGFDVPTSSLSSGNWQATITFTSDTQTGSASKAVAIP